MIPWRMWEAIVSQLSVFFVYKFQFVKHDFLLLSNILKTFDQHSKWPHSIAGWSFLFWNYGNWVVHIPTVLAGLACSGPTAKIASVLSFLDYPRVCLVVKFLSVIHLFNYCATNLFNLLWKLYVSITYIINYAHLGIKNVIN